MTTPDQHPQQEHQQERGWWSPLTLEAVLDEDIKDEDWLWEPFWRRKGRMLWYGPPGVYKSLAAVQMLQCLATGTDWMGSRLDRRASGLYVRAEVSPKMFQDRVSCLLACIPSRDGAQVWSQFAPELRLDQASTFAWLTDRVQELGVEALVLDPTYYFISGNPNLDEIVSFYTRGLDFIINHANCAVLIINNRRKGQVFMGSPVQAGLDDSKGNNIFVHWADTALSFAPTSAGVRVTTEKLRGGEKGKPWVVKYVAGQIVVASGKTEEALVARLAAGPQPTGELEQALAQEEGLSVRQVQRVKKKLVTEGVIVEQVMAGDARKTVLKLV